jgi:hypothetical protein
MNAQERLLKAGVDLLLAMHHANEAVRKAESGDGLLSLEQSAELLQDIEEAKGYAQYLCHASFAYEYETKKRKDDDL